MDLFAGDVDFVALVKALRQIGYDDWLTLEMLPNYRQFPEGSPFSNKPAVDQIMQMFQALCNTPRNRCLPSVSGVLRAENSAMFTQKRARA